MDSPKRAKTSGKSEGHIRVLKRHLFKAKEKAAHSHLCPLAEQLGLKTATLETLPTEIKHHILSFLSVLDLSLLAITSRQLLHTTEAYRRSPQGSRRMIPGVSPHDLSSEMQKQLSQHFRDLAVYMKRASCLLQTRERLKMCDEYLVKHFLCRDPSCRPHACLSLTWYGKFLRTLTAGWHEKECHRVVDHINQNVLVMRHVRKAFGEPGLFWQSEYFTRLFYRRVYLDDRDKPEERAFWLNCLLRNLVMVHQARLLLILYGPASSDRMEWSLLAEQAQSCIPALRDVAQALEMLRKYCWNEDNVVSVIEEITAIPEPWHPENTAHLLLECGERISVPCIGSKAINNRLRDISQLSVYLTVACFKKAGNVGSALSVIWSVSQFLQNFRDKLTFLQTILDGFHDATDVQGNLSADVDQIRSIREAQLLYTKALTTMLIDVLQRDSKSFDPKLIVHPIEE